MKRALIAIAAAGMFAGPVQATLYSHDFGSGQLESPDSIPVTFNSPAAGAGTLSFDLAGFNSLDGNNYYIDVFSLSVYGNNVLSGTFNMGGAGQ